MKKITFRQRFRYWLDLRMAAGTASMVKLLLIMVLASVVFVTSLVLLFHLHPEGKHVIAVFWDNMRSAMSSSFPSSDSGSLLYIILYTMLGLTGMIFTGMLIGLFSSTMRGKLIALQQDNPEIIETGHTVILGFRIGEYALLKEIIAAAEDEKKTIVIAENLERQEIEQAIRKNISVPKNVRLTAIKADTTSPAAISVCGISRCSTLVVHTRDKGRTIKTLLVAEILLTDSKKRPVIVTSIDTADRVLSEEIQKERGSTVLHSGDVTARIIARSAAQTGIYEALLDMIDFENYEFYFEHRPETAGLQFGQVLLSGRKAIVTGISRSEQTLINPPADTILQKDDLLITFEEEPKDLILENPAGCKMPEPVTLQPAPMINEIAVFGVNPSLSTILHEFPDNIRRVRLVGVTERDRDTFLPNSEEYPFDLVRDQRSIESDQDLYEIIRHTRHICLLADRRRKEEDADTDTMLMILRLRNIKRKYGMNFTLTAEMCLESNRNLINSETAEDFIVATDLSSMMLAQIAADVRRAPVFTELLDEIGSEVYMKPASWFGLTGMELTYPELLQKVYATGAILMGIRTPEESFRILADRTEPVTLTEKDYLILLAEN